MRPRLIVRGNNSCSKIHPSVRVRKMSWFPEKMKCALYKTGSAVHYLRKLLTKRQFAYEQVGSAVVKACTEIFLHISHYPYLAISVQDTRYMSAK